MKSKQETTTTLVLSKKEALWLKWIVQNPMGCTPEKEDPIHKGMRKVFWDALKDVNF